MVLVGLGRLSQPRHGGDGFVEGIRPFLLRWIVRVAADLFADAFEVILDALWRGVGRFPSLVLAPGDGGGEAVAHDASLAEPVALRRILLVHPGSQAAKMEGILAGIAAKQITLIIADSAIIRVLRHVTISFMSVSV